MQIESGGTNLPRPLEGAGSYKAGLESSILSLGTKFNNNTPLPPKGQYSWPIRSAML